MAIRVEEQFCQKAFTDFLRAEHKVHSAVWEIEPNGEKTVPDFHLHHGSVTYAVEVTGLMAQYDQTEGQPVSELGIWKATERLADEVEREATDQGSLHGIYILTLDGPYEFFHRSRKDIKKALTDFIANTQGIDQVPMPLSPSVTPSGQSYFLHKVGSQENLVGVVMLEDGAGWGWSVTAGLLSMVQGAIVSKAVKLRSISPPWVLLLLDRHHIATARDYADVRNRLSSTEWDSSILQEFHSIYIINGRSQVFPLYLPRRAWCG
jgi:hypothetical protein